MKILLTIFTLLVSTVMFSSPSLAEWTKMGKSVVGNTFYVDFERMRKHDGYVYLWILLDYLKPDETGTLSSKLYIQVDCKLFRFKFLSYIFHKEPMGGGTGTVGSAGEEWTYPPPNGFAELTLEKVCSR